MGTGLGVAIGAPKLIARVNTNVKAAGGFKKTMEYVWRDDSGSVGWGGQGLPENVRKNANALNSVSRNFQVEPFELLGGRKGRDFALYGEDGIERFSARLLDGETTLNIGWTDNVARTGIRLREVQQLAGGQGSLTRITGMASDQLEAAIRTGTFNSNKAAEMLGKSLGGNWRVTIIPRPGQAGVFDIVAELIQ